MAKVNARVEFDEFIAEVGIPLICAVVKREVYYPDRSCQEIVLGKPEDIPQFLELLDFERDGGNEEFAKSICWFEDGSWGDMEVVAWCGLDTYYWCHRSRPEIPEFILPSESEG